MDDALNIGESSPFEVLRQFARRRPARDEERCDLCGESIGPEHRHLLELATRQISCACRACTLLLDAPTAGGGARRLIPTRILCLDNFAMTDVQWECLEVPVNMAFFVYNSAARQMAAYYPSPMGPTEAQLPPAAWEELAELNPILREMEPDVEALLVRRGSANCGCWIVPIDACYRLVGLEFRMHWKGLSGGNEVREQIEGFFANLKEHADRVGGAHA